MAGGGPKRATHHSGAVRHFCRLVKKESNLDKNFQAKSSGPDKAHVCGSCYHSGPFWHKVLTWLWCNTPKLQSVITWLEGYGHRAFVHLVTYDHHHSEVRLDSNLLKASCVAHSGMYIVFLSIFFFFLWSLILHQIKMQRHTEWSPQEVKEATAEVGVGQNSEKGVHGSFL